MDIATDSAAPLAHTETQTLVQNSASGGATTAPDKPDAAQDPQWLGARLDRERKSVLKQLGVENVDDAKAAIDELKKRRDADKSESDRLRAELDAVSKIAAKAKDLEAVIALQANAAVAALSDAQREAVLKLSGEDHAATLRAIEALRPTWAPAIVLAAGQTSQQPAKQAPLSTSPSTPSPTPSASEHENHKATYERLRIQDPQKAAAYRIANWSQFFGK